MSPLNSLLNRFLFNPLRVLTAPFRIIFGWPWRMIGHPRRFWGMSLPTRVAVLLFLFLTALVITAGLLYWNWVGRADFWHFVASKGWLVAVLLIAIPLLAWQTVKLFLEGNVSSHPRIDAAWQEGLRALRANHLDLTRLPIFLVLGPHSPADADRLMDASGKKFPVCAIPEGRHPLRWYANERGVFLVCLDASCLAVVNTPQTSGGPRVDQTLQQQGGVTATLVSDGVPETRDDRPAMSEPALDESDLDVRGSIWGTLVAGIRNSLVPGGTRRSVGETPRTVLTREQKETSAKQLRHICQLIRRGRQPFCPLNGILTTVSWEVMQNSLIAGRELPEAVKQDLETVESTTEIRCPVTVLVTGLEAEKGFLELVRRVGPEKSRARFGRGFELSNTPTALNLEALAAHACGAFEDFVYRLFREPGGLGKLGNTQLYSLLCKIRSLSVRMRKVLASGFAQQSGGSRRILAGLYFAATGGSPDTRCFVEGVIDKMIDAEEEVEWSEPAIHADRRFLTAADVGMFVNTVLVIVIGVLVYKVVFSS